MITRRLMPVLGLVLLGACAQDPFLMRHLQDSAPGAETSWLDLEFPPDVSRHDAGVDRSLPDRSLSRDACLALPELCNNVDDNCNGETDEGFDKLSDPRYCERCKGCAWLLANDKNAYPACVQGSCAIKSCVAGYVDLDHQIGNGCEYKCLDTGAELCDGEDNDCNGKVDDNLTPPAIEHLCKQLGPCAGATLLCRGKAGWQCSYGPGVELQPCHEDRDCGGGLSCTSGTCPGVVIGDEERCDGQDGDCDGQADELWSNPLLSTALDKACDLEDSPRQGACRAVGVYACAADGKGTVCRPKSCGGDEACQSSLNPGLRCTAGTCTAATPSTESCNGIDDDCDGKVDEALADSGGAGVVDATVHVVRTVGPQTYDYYIYAFEASRPDATAQSAGKMNHRACSKAGALPWARVSYAEAQAACAASGKRLCSGLEWLLACEGAATALYPYGDGYETERCNGFERGEGKALPTGSLDQCLGGEKGLFDMSGNLREWTDDRRSMTEDTPPKAVYVVRGGAYNMPWPALQCSFELSQAVEDVVLPSIGFRCCGDSP